MVNLITCDTLISNRMKSGYIEPIFFDTIVLRLQPSSYQTYIKDAICKKWISIKTM